MPRAGSGSSSHSYSGGGHHSSHSGGGHHVSSSSHRAGSGSSSYNSNHSYSHSSYRRSYGRSYGSYGGYYGGSRIGATSSLIIMIVFIALAAIFVNMFSNRTIKSDHTREKITGHAFVNDCVIDEIGWIDSINQTEKGLKNFWDKTGAQPYVLLKAYDPTLKTDAEKDAWSIQYYEDQKLEENTFLFVYFAEENTDYDVGYMTYTNGYESSSVMDAEAVDIFWSYIDRYWTSDMTTDDVIVSSFDSTASSIMADHSLRDFIIKIIAMLVVVVLVSIILFKFMSAKRKAERERAEETERILNSPTGDTFTNTEVENLKDKYSKGGNE